MQSAGDRSRRYALLIAALYVLFGGMWILFSDRFIAFVYTTPEELTVVQTWKGWFYVVVTAVPGYFLVLWALRRRSDVERAIQVSEKRLASILETTQDGVWESGADGACYCSDSVFTMLGHAPQACDDIDTFLKAIMHPEDLESWELRTREIKLGTRDSFEREVRLRANDGTWRHILARVKCPERDPDGRAVRIVGAHTDISTLKQVDEALRKANLIVESSPAVLFRWRAEDTWPVEYVSDNISQWGYTPETFLSGETTFADIIHPEDLPRVAAKAHEYESRGLTSFQMEYRLYAREGTLRWVNEHSAIERDGEGRAEFYQGLVLDNTARKGAELALKESQARYKSLFEAANDAIYLMDGSCVIACNARAEELYGVSRESILGTTPTKYSPPIQPDGTPSEEAAAGYAEQALAGAPQFFVWKHVRTDGVEFCTEVSLNRVQLGDRYFVQAIERDITERLRAEEERSRLESQLHHAQKMEAVGQLAGGLAHDFNNVLQVIRGNIDLARQDAAAGLPVDECLDEMALATEQATALVGQLLAFSRRMPLKTKRLHIGTLVRELTKMLQRLIGEDIELHLHCTERPAYVEADPAQMQQAVINLCLNARDAMPDGGTIGIEVTNEEIAPEFCRMNPWARPGRYVKLSVSDTGTGIPEEIREHVFEPFCTTKDVGKGTGLGLASVYASVQRSNGLITFTTESGEGTTFDIYLPEREALHDEAEGTALAPAPEPVNGTILLAEDEELVRNFAVRVLTHAGFTVHAAHDGEEALAIYRSHTDEIDLLLLDVVMPKMHGPMVYDEIAASGAPPPVVFSSGYSEAATPWQDIPASNVHVLHKPYPPAELIDLISKALAAARRERGSAEA